MLGIAFSDEADWDVEDAGIGIAHVDSVDGVDCCNGNGQILSHLVLGSREGSNSPSQYHTIMSHGLI